MATSKVLKPRRGSTAEHATFKGQAYEITFDTDKKTIVAHDGLTMGGFPLAHESAVSETDSALRALIDQKVSEVEGVSSSELRALESALRGLINNNAQQQTARDNAQDDALTSLNSALRTLIQQELAKKLDTEGGTMTGSARCQAIPYNIIVQSLSQELGKVPAANLFAGIEFRDKNDARVAWLGTRQNTSGDFNLEIQVMNGGRTLSVTDGGLITAAGVSLELPIGTVISFAANRSPVGYLFCDGAAISRTTYAQLFAVIGITYGAGDGSTTFNLPDLRDRFIQGHTDAGKVRSSGLPNITGSFDTGDNNAGVAAVFSSSSGAFAGKQSTNRYADDLGSGTNTFGLTFDASKSNAIYGASTIVQPPAVTMRPYIKYQ